MLIILINQTYEIIAYTQYLVEILTFFTSPDLVNQKGRLYSDSLLGFFENTLKPFTLNVMSMKELM